MKKSKLPLGNILFILFLFLGANLKGQVTQIDSTKITEVPADAEEIHSPKKAAILSALLPGLGQAYNRKYWKIPLIYGGFGTIGYFIGWNNRNYKTTRLAYKDFTDGDDNTNSYMDLSGWKQYNESGNYDPNEFKNVLNKQQDYYRRNRDLLIIVMAGFYGLNIIDASVDAHLFNFDISEDLTFDWQPAMQNMDENVIYGFNCRLNF